MNAKYELTKETKNGLFRIRAKVAFGNVAAGELGGFIASEVNLSVYGNAWVSCNAWVSGDARVYGNARVYGDARVYGYARVYGAASFLLIGPIGSRRAFLSIYADAKIKVRYTTGCFSGSRAEFIAAVKKTHKAGTLYRKQYDAALAMGKLVKP